MTYLLSKHAKKEMERRGIPEYIVMNIMENPGQIVEEYGQKKAYQSIVDFDQDHKYLVRVIVDDISVPAVVVTVYRTSKIAKYWRES